MTTAKDILVKAKDELKTRGIYRGGWYVNQETGCEVCSIGSIFLADGHPIVFHPATFEVNWNNEPEEVPAEYEFEYAPMSSEGWLARNCLEQAVRETGLTTPYGTPMTVPQFNDNHATDEEILAVFDRAIELAE